MIKNIQLITLKSSGHGPDHEALEAQHIIELDAPEGERLYIVLLQGCYTASAKLMHESPAAGTRTLIVRHDDHADVYTKITLHDYDVCEIAKDLIQASADGARTVITAADDALAKINKTIWVDPATTR